MAQIAAQYPNLQGLFGASSLFPLEYGLQQQESAQKSTELNQQQALQDMLFQQQNDPLKLQRASLENQGLEAGLPGLWANSGMLQDKAAVSRGSLGEQIAGAQSSLKAKASQDEIAQLHSHAEKMAMSQDPQEAAVGMELLKHTKDFMLPEAKQNAQQERMLAQIRAQGEQQRLTQAQAIESGKYRQGGGAGSGPQDIWQAMSMGKMGFEKGAMALYAQAQQAYQAGDAQTAAQLMEMANQANQMYIQGRQAGANANQEGKVDISKMGVQTKSAPPVQNFQPTGRVSTTGENTPENAERIRIVQREYDSATNPQDKAALGRELERLRSSKPVSQLPQGYTPQKALDEAKKAIAGGRDRNAVIQRLKQMGVNPEGL